MQTVIDVGRLKPIGTRVLIRREPDQEKRRGFIIPEEYQCDRNAHIYSGTLIAVGNKTKSARFGHERGCVEPGDIVFFWNQYEWNDKDIVVKDLSSGGEYLVLDESDIKAFKIGGEEL